MGEKEKQLEALEDIRNLMRESSKFISLAGLSGVFAGIYALLGAFAGSHYIWCYNHSDRFSYEELLLIVLSICIAVLVFSLLTAYLLSLQKARKKGLVLFDHTSKKLLLSMGVPLLAGGVLCITMLYHGGTFIYLICPTMLLFYGVALVNSAKYTIHRIEILGYTELLLGVLACIFMGNGLLFWSLGFGVFHILYGIVMWLKYDYKK